VRFEADATEKSGRRFVTIDPQVRRPAKQNGRIRPTIGLTEGDMATKTLVTQVAVSQRIVAGLVCLFIGASAIFMVGLSDMSVAHNAAHDTRHAIGFPCH
jgi:cobalt transporter subunit CbtB